MKKFLLSCFGVCLVGSASFAALDYQCYDDCTGQGYTMGYCQKKCSYHSPSITQPPIPPYNNKQLDYQCYNDCLGKGYMMGYCQDKCSY